MARSVLLLMLVLPWGAEGGSVQGPQRRDKVLVTISKTQAVSKVVDTDDLGSIPAIPDPSMQAPLMPSIKTYPPSPGLARDAIPVPNFPDPDYDGGDQNIVPVFPTAPPLPPVGPIGPDTHTPDSGGHMGDRCPNQLKLEDGSWPAICYDVIDEHGSCMMDDMVLSRQQCVDAFGQAFYDDLVRKQEDLVANRTKAKEEGKTGADLAAEGATSDVAKQHEEAIAAEGRSVERSPSKRSGPQFNMETLTWLNAEQAEPAPSLVPLGPPTRKKRDGPRFNTGVLGSLDFLDAGPLPTLPPLGQHKRDMPQFNMAALDSLNFQDAGPLPTLPPLGQHKRDMPQFNMAALDSLNFQDAGPLPTLPPLGVQKRGKLGAMESASILDLFNSQQKPNKASYQSSIGSVFQKRGRLGGMESESILDLFQQKQAKSSYQSKGPMIGSAGRKKRDSVDPKEHEDIIKSIMNMINNQQQKSGDSKRDDDANSFGSDAANRIDAEDLYDYIMGLFDNQQ